jgi:uncharacterized membrane protein YgaE (UPF0421/DUF939 family)
MKLPNKEWLVDAAERVVMTFLATFVAAWLAVPTLDLETNKALAFAALTAAVTLAKTIVTGFLTGGASAAPATSVAAVHTKEA